MAPTTTAFNIMTETTPWKPLNRNGIPMNNRQISSQESSSLSKSPYLLQRKESAQAGGMTNNELTDPASTVKPRPWGMQFSSPDTSTTLNQGLTYSTTGSTLSADVHAILNQAVPQSGTGKIGK